MEKQGLLAPESYWKLSEDERYEIVNGCGPERVTGLIPNSIFGINLKPACDIHDYTYTKATAENRHNADNLFFLNMYSIARKHRSIPMRVIGTISAGFYFIIVKLLGGYYFK